MREPEILHKINRQLRAKYAAFRVSGLPGDHGAFAVYTKAPPPLGELRRVGEAFSVRANGRFNRDHLPAQARLGRKKSQSPPESG